MPYLIDSDVLIAQREGQPGALALLERLAPEGLAIFLAGVPVVHFTLATARRCAGEREDLSGQGKRVRSRALDLMTAAIALEHGYTLVTRNRKDYEDIAGLALYDLP